MAANTHVIDLESTSSQYLSASDSASLSVTGDLTIMAWVNPESDPNESNIASKYRGVSGGNNRSFETSVYDDQVRFVVSSNGSTGAGGNTKITAGLIPNATWTHVAWAWDASASSCEVFINGVTYDTITTGSVTSIHDNGSSLFIGASGNNSGTAVSFFDGKIDDVRIYSRLLSSTEIANEYCDADNANTTNLEAHWRLDNSLLDETANNNDLTNNNTAVFVTDIHAVCLSPEPAMFFAANF